MVLFITGWHFCHRWPTMLLDETLEPCFRELQWRMQHLLSLQITQIIHFNCISTLIVLAFLLNNYTANLSKVCKYIILTFGQLWSIPMHRLKSLLLPVLTFNPTYNYKWMCHPGEGTRKRCSFTNNGRVKRVRPQEGLGACFPLSSLVQASL